MFVLEPTLQVSLSNLLSVIATRSVRDNTTRYKARKVVTFFGYLAAVIFVVLVFSDKL